MHFAAKTIVMFLGNYYMNFKKMFFGVLKVVCEGRFFEWLGDAMGASQKVVLEQTTSAWAKRLFYITLLWFFGNHNATLCNTAWGKFLLPLSNFSF
jgi:cellobiose-specific phosphotransferase system component IIC